MSTKFGQILLQISENFYHYFCTISRPNFTDSKLELYHFLDISYNENLKQKEAATRIHIAFCCGFLPI